MNIYVGNLSYGLSEQDLMNTFIPFGEVISVKIIIDQQTGQSKGFGFVEMTHQGEAEDAINALNGTSIKGRSIKVNQAKSKPS
jgi:RNA recognition motif-containing protein